MVGRNQCRFKTKLIQMKYNMIFLFLATLTVGLSAGFMSAWTLSVTNGISRISDVNYLHAFQSMNRAIINLPFLIFFLGPIILLPLATYFNIKPEFGMKFWCIVAGSILYLVGVMGVTFLGNIPLNNTLDQLPIDNLSEEELRNFRMGFEEKWNRLHTIRTITSSLAFILLCYSCLLFSND